MIEKLALGTVQFGLDYGINNQSGQVPPSEVEQIIAICRQAGIITLDTAYAYGESERVLGKIGISDFRLISKLPPCDVKDVKNIVQESLERLNLKSIDSYMLHNFSIYKKDKTIWDILKAIKEAQKIKK